MRRLRGCRSLAPQSQQRGVRSFSAESLTLVSPRITKIHCEDRSQDAILNLNWLQTFSFHVLSILAASRGGQVLLVPKLCSPSIELVFWRLSTHLCYFDSVDDSIIDL